MTTMTAAQLRAQTAPMEQVPDPEVPERPRPPRSYPAAYKLRILEEYERLDKAAKGALLRREGLYTSLISEWRKQRDKGALQAFQQRRVHTGRCGVPEALGVQHLQHLLTLGGLERPRLQYGHRPQQTRR